MTKKSNSEFSKTPRMTYDEAMKLLALIEPITLPKNKALLLSEIMPISKWQTLTQDQKGIVGLVFCMYLQQLGFEYAHKDKSGTTNLYRLVTE
jgi:hypothetical protein